MSFKLPPVTLLIDGDPIVYLSAFAGQETFNFDGMKCKATDPDRAKGRAKDFIDWVSGLLKPKRVIVCLSDPEKNWRHSILPSYKGNRDKDDRPALWSFMRNYLSDNYEIYQRPTLEADDVMGILSTHPKLISGRKIIVSIDKDMQTIPGYLFNPDKDKEPRLIGVKQATDFHMYQTLVGDVVDNYKGCPGIGHTKATEILENPYEVIMEPYTVSRGKNKGEVRMRYSTKPTRNLWRAVVTQYLALGLTERDALVQAQVSRICRTEDYNFNKKEVTPWQPNRLL